MPPGIYDHRIKRTGENIVCPTCKSYFYVPKCYLSRKKYCSLDCRNNSKEYKELLSLNMKGKKKTVTKAVIEGRKIQAEKLKGHSCYKNPKRRENLSLGQKKAWKNDFKRKIKTAEVMRKNREIFKFKFTNPEIRMSQILDTLGMEYFQQKYIWEIEHKYNCDFYLPRYHMIIEVDGEYWHNYPHGTELDNVRTKELEEKGYTVIRMWSKNIEKIREVVI